MPRPKTNRPPTYLGEVKFYRDVLKISYESGTKWRQLGVIRADALMDDGRPIFLLSPEAIQAAKARIHQYRVQVARSRFNLPVSTLCEKTPIATV